eukprot:6009444-Pyramimonas_sp.AAC.1
MGGGTARATTSERSHWDLWWSSLWGHEAREGCAEMGGGNACAAKANAATGAVGGAPYGARKRVRGVPTWG